MSIQILYGFSVIHTNFNGFLEFLSFVVIHRDMVRSCADNSDSHSQPGLVRMRAYGQAVGEYIPIFIGQAFDIDRSI